MAAPARRGTVTRRVHVVRSGETLSAIALQFRVPVASVMQANGLSGRSVLRPGQTVRIP